MASERLFLKQEEIAILDEFAGRALQGLLSGFYSGQGKYEATSANSSIYDEAYSMAYQMMVVRKRWIDLIVEK